MTSLNINLKIEAKKSITSKGLDFLRKQGIGLNNIYMTFEKDTFLLPYKVQKLSKKARKQ